MKQLGLLSLFAGLLVDSFYGCAEGRRPCCYWDNKPKLNISLEHAVRPSGTVNSTGYPDPPLIPNGNQENRWNVNCDGETEVLYAKSDGLAFNLTYDCFPDDVTSTPTSLLSKPRIQSRTSNVGSTTTPASQDCFNPSCPCVDILPPEKCEKRRRNNNCHKLGNQRKCRKTCGLCTLACKVAYGPSGTVESPGHPDIPSIYESCWNVTCDEGDIRTLYFKSEIPYISHYDCFSSKKCENEWPKKKCKKCKKQKCKKDSCKSKCKKTCDLCEDGETSSSEECEDKWFQKKCKRCNEKSVRRIRNVLRTVRRPASYAMIALLHLIHFTRTVAMLQPKRWI